MGLQYQVIEPTLESIVSPAEPWNPITLESLYERTDAGRLYHARRGTFWVIPLEEISQITYWARQSDLTPELIDDLESRMNEVDERVRAETIDRVRPGFLFDREICRLAGFAVSHRGKFKDWGREEIIFAHIFGA